MVIINNRMVPLNMAVVGSAARGPKSRHPAASDSFDMFGVRLFALELTWAFNWCLKRVPMAFAASVLQLSLSPSAAAAIPAEAAFAPLANAAGRAAELSTPFLGSLVRGFGALVKPQGWDGGSVEPASSPGRGITAYLEAALVQGSSGAVEAVGGSPDRSGGSSLLAATRLDVPSSGLLVVALSGSARAWLSLQMHRYTVQRLYVTMPHAPIPQLFALPPMTHRGLCMVFPASNRTLQCHIST